MRVLLVSVPLEFPLAAYCLAAQVRATPDLCDVDVRILNLDAARLQHYNEKNPELWRFAGIADEYRPDMIAFSVYLWNAIM